MNKRLTGKEDFIFEKEKTGIKISDFWSWAYSDLLNNTYRGILAEFIVFSAISKNDSSNIRVDWMPYDITSPSGRKIEVKSSAYLQSWIKEYYSEILFDIAPKYAWSPDQGYSPERKRNSDLYVFCVYTALTKEQYILNLDFWDFYVISTSVLNNKNPEQKKIGLSSLMKLNPIKTTYTFLKDVVESIEL